MENTQRWIDTGYYITKNAPVAAAIVVMAVVLGAFLISDWLHNRRKSQHDWLNANPKRRGKVLRKERRQYVDSLVTDEFTDRIEQLVYDGILTRTEAKDVYVRLKRLFPVRNIFPSPEALKENIRRRLQSTIHAPVKLPDSKPKPKHMFDVV